MSGGSTDTVAGADRIGAMIADLAAELALRLQDIRDPCLIGVQRRGDTLARRLRSRLRPDDPDSIPLGSLDITLYRDDFDSLTETPIVGNTDIPFPVEGRTVVLVDDVLFSGRTIRAALEEIHEFGRPRRVLLVVLVDRGWRELPIAADLVGMTIETGHGDNVQVLLREQDDIDEIRVERVEG